MLQDFVFLGTGTSGYVPVIPCLTDPTRSCKACQMAVQPGNRNRRRNTSGLLRYLHSDGRVRNILIDCGKSFYESSLAFFPAFGVQRIDALLLTHGHCDAMMGLDDLRQWTLGKNPIQTSVDVYLTQETMNVVKGSFPYLVNQKYATGGGEVASLKFHIIQNDPFYVQELVVVPIPVEHGKIGSAPFWSLGFRFDNFTYISDVSGVPPKSKSLILGSEILVVDALQVACHLSHFSRDEACALIKELVPNGKGYLTGISHKMEHEELQSWLLESYPQIKCAYDGLCIKF